jgi:hypothetical protein
MDREGSAVRKTAKVVISAEGRDKGKHFLLTEMFASQGEAWAMRVIMALADSGVQLPDEFETLGMAGLAELGFKMVAGLKWNVAEPLLREMFDCIQITVNPTQATATTRALQGDNGDYDIEEISTRLQLRVEVWKLHMGFLQAALPFLQDKGKPAAAKRSHIATSQP